MSVALKVWGASLRDVWQELWTILVVHILFLLGLILVVPGPPAILALFAYGNKIAHGDPANERDFLAALRTYWGPAWRWGLLNGLALGLLIGDYYLLGQWASASNRLSWFQGFYITILAGWLLLQLFALPFFFEQEQPSVLQALRNGLIFIGQNLALVVVLGLLLVLSLTLGTFLFMLSFVFGGAFLAFAGNHAVLERLAHR